MLEQGEFIYSEVNYLTSVEYLTKQVERENRINNIRQKAIKKLSHERKTELESTAKEVKDKYRGWLI